jgi:hypothetical protein
LAFGLALVAGLFSLFASPVASAEPAEPAAESAANGNPEHSLLFSGVDAARAGFFVYSGARLTPFSQLGQSGPIFGVFAGGGQYRYFMAPGSPVTGRVAVGEALAGYQFTGANHAIALFAGVRRVRHDLDTPDPGNPVQGAETGAVFVLDGWAKPVPGTLVTLAADASTAFSGYYARATAGRALPLGDNLYGGCEAVLLGNENYRQWRFGGHLTGLALGQAELGLSGGWFSSDDGDDGLYGNLALWRRY